MPITKFFSIPNFTMVSDETPSDVVYQVRLINRNFPVDKEFPVLCFYSQLSLNLVLFSCPQIEKMTLASALVKVPAIVPLGQGIVKPILNFPNLLPSHI